MDMNSDRFNDAVGQELRAAMGRAKLSQPKLAKRSGVPLGTLRRYMDGTREIPLPALYRLLVALEVESADFDAALRRALCEK